MFRESMPDFTKHVGRAQKVYLQTSSKQGSLSDVIFESMGMDKIPPAPPKKKKLVKKSRPRSISRSTSSERRRKHNKDILRKSGEKHKPSPTRKKSTPITKPKIRKDSTASKKSKHSCPDPSLHNTPPPLTWTPTPLPDSNWLPFPEQTNHKQIIALSTPAQAWSAPQTRKHSTASNPNPERHRECCTSEGNNPHYECHHTCHHKHNAISHVKEERRHSVTPTTNPGHHAHHQTCVRKSQSLTQRHDCKHKVPPARRARQIPEDLSDYYQFLKIKPHRVLSLDKKGELERALDLHMSPTRDPAPGKAMYRKKGNKCVYCAVIFATVLGTIGLLSIVLILSNPKMTQHLVGVVGQEERPIIETHIADALIGTIPTTSSTQSSIDSNVAAGVNTQSKTPHTTLPVAAGLIDGDSSKGKHIGIGMARDCEDIPSKFSGIFTIRPDGLSLFNVSCDMDTHEGGWTVIQRRQLGNIIFTKPLRAYEDGFGDLAGDHWLGNKKIHLLTFGRTQQLLLRLTILGKHYWVEYTEFSVASKREGYKLSISGYNPCKGAVVDALTGKRSNSSSRIFSASSGIHRDRSCAYLYKSGWWFDECGMVNVNGKWGLPAPEGMFWGNYANLLQSSTLLVKRRSKPFHASWSAGSKASGVLYTIIGIVAIVIFTHIMDSYT